MVGPAGCFNRRARVTRMVETAVRPRTDREGTAIMIDQPPVCVARARRAVAPHPLTAGSPALLYGGSTP